MTKEAFIVQFPHPGVEHRPKGPVMHWNTKRHARKYMTAEGAYLDEQGRQKRGQIVFWGEWEGPSRVLQRWQREPPLPRFMHEPYFEPPTVRGFRLNTDPWVFGDAFRYSNCKQRTNKGKTATAMQRLCKGSVILFGSSVDGGACPVAC